MRESSARWARISRAPSAQLRPIVKGLAWRSEYQKAAGVWPESVRPDRSVIVPEIMTGNRSPLASKTSSMRKQCRLGVERVEDRLDDQKIGAALDQRGRGFGIGLAQLVEAHRAKTRIVDVGRNRGGAIGWPQGAGDEAARIPSFCCAASAASRASRAETKFKSATSSSMP